MLLEEFLLWNSVIQSFQCEINGVSEYPRMLGLLRQGKNIVKIDDVCGMGMS